MESMAATLSDSLTIKQALVIAANDLHDALVDHTLAIVTICGVGFLLTWIIFFWAIWLRGKQLKSLDTRVNAALAQQYGIAKTGNEPPSGGVS